MFYKSQYFNNLHSPLFDQIFYTLFWKNNSLESSRTLLFHLQSIKQTKAMSMIFFSI